MRVAELMRTDVKSIEPGASIADLIHKLADARVSGLPVLDESAHVIGVVTATDVLRSAAGLADVREKPSANEPHTVSDIMTPKPHLIAPDDDVRDAAKHMLYADVRRLFVEEGGRLVGVISQTDIAQAVGTGRL
ncbi:MAG: CBS domain-containing protein [Gemmatimonadaceae bacterium]